MLETAVDVVFTSEDYGDGFAASLTIHLADLRPGKPPVEHICFDPERRQVPVSGTAVRADPDGHRENLAPVVAATFGSH
jgi:hypothetical protein